MFRLKRQSDEQKQELLNRLLCREKALCSFLSEIPQVFILPLRNPDKKGIFVWLYLQNNIKISNKLIIDLITMVVTLFLQKFKFINEYEGIEVIPSIRQENGESDRIVRITIYRNSYQKWSEMKSEELCKEKPYEGIQCGWYWDPRTMTNPLNTGEE